MEKCKTIQALEPFLLSIGTALKCLFAELLERAGNVWLDSSWRFKSNFVSVLKNIAWEVANRHTT